MAPPDIKSTELLTEHFGFPPIAIIDDIINAVNEIMYKCTQAVEEFLIELDEKRPDRVEVRGNDIEVGTAKLETLLENAVDKNFDKFELYALRNILTIPNDLNDGWIRLKHNENIPLDTRSELRSAELDLQIDQLFKDITVQFRIRNLLLVQLKKGKNLIQLMTLYKDGLGFLFNDDVSEESSRLLKSISPLDETLYYLLTQTEELYSDILKLQSQFDLKLNQSERDKYLNVESTKLLKVLGLVTDKPRLEKVIDQMDFELNDEQKNRIKEAFGII